MKVTDEMVDAARDAVRRVTGGAFTPSGLLTRAALQAALAAAPPCEYIRSTGEGTHHCALDAAPHGEPVAWAQKEALEGVREYGEITCTLYAEGYQPEQEWTEPLYTAPQPEAVARAVTYAVDGMSVCLTDCVNTSAPQPAPDDKLREVARQALEALTANERIYTEPAGFAGKWGSALDRAISKQQVKIDAARATAQRAITALRDALEGEE